MRLTITIEGSEKSDVLCELDEVVHLARVGVVHSDVDNANGLSTHCFSVERDAGQFARKQSEKKPVRKGKRK